jgi:DNA-binding CsgD family transcriptional regulator
MASDILSLVEAAYDVERAEPAWLDNLVGAAESTLGEKLGVGGYLYDASSRPIRTWSLTVRAGLDPRTLAAGCASFDDDYRRANWLMRRFGTLSEFPELAPKLSDVDVFARLGIRDVVAVNALDPSGLGCWLVAPLSAVLKPTKPLKQRWQRVATHLAAAVRLRARLERSNPRLDPTKAADAVLSPSGKIEEAHGGAEATSARKALHDAALSVERARGAGRRADADLALASWPALVNGRWTLVDHFESDGRRYVLAHTNTAARPNPQALSAREREVLERALLGHENKLIAYELGLAASTVRVLMKRAAAKLGVLTREDAVAVYRRAREP